jgi:uncharacterized membrane protein YhaH (DUF805 family)/type II secretory pathway pseudopilin PulG
MNVFTANRIGRLVYFGWMLCICFISAIITVYVREGLYGDESSPVLVLTGIISAGFAAFPIVKRLHDLNKSGWLWLLGLIPLVNFCFGIYLLFGKGTDGSNDYGAPPEKLLKKNRIGPSSVVHQSDENNLYQQIYEELENGQVNKALWARVFTESEGDESKAKALYIKSRVTHIRSAPKNEAYGSQPEKSTASKEQRSNVISLAVFGLITIIALGVIVGVTSTNKLGSGNEVVAHAILKAIESAIQNYEMDNLRLPDSLNDLTTQKEGHGPYLKPSELTDPWGWPVIYAKPGSHGIGFDLSCKSPEGKEFNNWRE